MKAATKKQKYQRILERKQATHPEQLCRGYPSEFKDYFAHCSSLGFEDRPDYRYLRRIFKTLFERQGFEDDAIYDWDILKKQEQGGTNPKMDNTTATGNDDVHHTDNLGNDGNMGGNGRGVPGMSGTDAPVEDSQNNTHGQRRSIISSIRQSLFGSRGSARDTNQPPTTASTTQPKPSR